MPTPIANLTNAFTFGGYNQLNNAQQQLNPLGTQQQQAYGSQLTNMLFGASNPAQQRADASSLNFSGANPAGTSIGQAQQSFVQSALSGPGLPSNAMALMAPYLQMLQGQSLLPAAGQLAFVAGAGSQGPSAQASQQQSYAQQLSSLAQGAGGLLSTGANWWSARGTDAVSQSLLGQSNAMGATQSQLDASIGSIGQSTSGLGNVDYSLPGTQGDFSAF